MGALLTTAVRRVLVSLAFGLAFVVNPVYVAGCIASDDDAEEEAARGAMAKLRLLEALDELNGEASWSFETDGVQYELLLELSQAQEERTSLGPKPVRAFLPVAHACGQVTFFQSASACATSYLLAVEGSFTLRRLGGAQPETIASDVRVSGLLEHYGGLHLQLPDGGSLYLERFSSTESFTLDSFTATNLGSSALDLSFEARSAR